MTEMCPEYTDTQLQTFARSHGVKQIDRFILAAMRAAFEAGRTHGQSDTMAVAHPITTSNTGRVQWRCFHCDATFTDEAAATEHFGKSEYQQPGCQIDLAEYRKMEEVSRRHCEEDTELHRTMYGMQSDHQTALQREEEKGYARGLKDGAALTPQPQSQSAAVGEAVTDGQIEHAACKYAHAWHQQSPGAQGSWMFYADKLQEFARAVLALAAPAQPVEKK